MRFGICMNTGLTLEEVGRQFPVSGSPSPYGVFDQKAVSFFSRESPAPLGLSSG